jgi:hypothetical protein
VDHRQEVTVGALWIVGEVVAEETIRVMDTILPLKMAWSDGMVGVAPVFKTETSARLYAKRRNEEGRGERDVWAVELVGKPPRKRKA